jgi:hypothetical protein
MDGLEYPCMGLRNRMVHRHFYKPTTISEQDNGEVI